MILFFFFRKGEFCVGEGTFTAPTKDSIVHCEILKIENCRHWLVLVFIISLLYRVDIYLSVQSNL